jgi:deoxyadenosine/deoxycytidine kinase
MQLNTSNTPSETETPKFIAIEGAIGIGKTSLCKRIADRLGGELVLEQAEQNPFLEKFYANPKQFAFQTQLFFLMQRAQQVNELRQNDMFQSVRIADFLIDKDSLFAKVNLNTDEYNLYMQVYEHLTINAPKPDLVVYLQASSEILMQRINKRGIKSERHITHTYLNQISDAYTEFFHFYNDSPLLIINATDVDFINNDLDFENLLDAMLNIKTGRHFINPQAQTA